MVSHHCRQFLHSLEVCADVVPPPKSMHVVGIIRTNRKGWQESARRHEVHDHAVHGHNSLLDCLDGQQTGPHPLLIQANSVLVQALDQGWMPLGSARLFYFSKLFNNKSIAVY